MGFVMNHVTMTALFLSLFLPSIPAMAFPELGMTTQAVSEPGEAAAGYNFIGIVALSNCSGSLVRFDDSEDDDKAMVLTNGHCVRMMDPGSVIFNQSSTRQFDVLDAGARRLGSVQAEQLVYATMTRTDMAVYRLKQTFAQIRSQFNVDPLTVARHYVNIGTGIEVISGYWKRGYACQSEAIVYQLREGNWTFNESVRYSRPGCDVIGGTSGSPVIAAGTRTVVAVNNTINESGKKCLVNNPCEVDEVGAITYEKGIGYSQQISWLYTCRNDAGVLDLAVDGCLLPKPAVTAY